MTGQPSGNIGPFRPTDHKDNIISANEGNAIAIAAGQYLATNKYPVVYL